MIFKTTGDIVTHGKKVFLELFVGNPLLSKE